MQTKWILAALTLTAVSGVSIRAQQAENKAQEILAEARKAIGGRKLDALRSLTLQAATQRNVGNFQMTSDLELFIELPDKYMRSETMTGGPMTMTNVSGFNGDSPIKSSGPGGIVTGGAMIIRMGPGAGPGAATGGEKPTPEQQQQVDAQLLRSARHEISRLMLGWFGSAHPSLPAQYSYAGEADSPDGKAHLIDAKNGDGFAARVFVDEKTLLPLMLTYQGPQPRMITSSGPRPQADAQRQLEELQKQPPAMVEYVLYFDDWREVDGIRFPHAFRRAVGGATTEEWTVSRVKVNPKIDPRKFQTVQ